MLYKNNEFDTLILEGNKEKWNETIIKAIKHNQVLLVRWFLANGFDINKFLTLERLAILYSETMVLTYSNVKN